MTSPIKGMYKMNGICIFEQIIVFFFLRSAMELILWDFSSKSGLFPHQSVLLWCVFAYPWVYTFRNIPEFSFKLMPEFLPKRCSIFYQDCKNLFLFLFPKLWLWNAHVTVQNRGFVSFFFFNFYVTLSWSVMMIYASRSSKLSFYWPYMVSPFHIHFWAPTNRFSMVPQLWVVPKLTSFFFFF